MQNVIIENTLDNSTMHALKGYLIHGLCTTGSAVVRFNEHDFTIHPNDSFIFVQAERTELITKSDDFHAIVVYVIREFTELATPLSNYGMRGGLMLFHDPLMPLNDTQAERCRKNFEYIGVRLQEKHHHFYRDLLLNAVQCMIIDFFDFHAEIYGETEISEKVANLVQSFLSMLNDGHYRKEGFFNRSEKELRSIANRQSFNRKWYYGIAASILLAIGIFSIVRLTMPIPTTDVPVYSQTYDNSADWSDFADADIFLDNIE